MIMPTGAEIVAAVPSNDPTAPSFVLSLRMPPHSVEAFLAMRWGKVLTSDVATGAVLMTLDTTLQWERSDPNALRTLN
jgi:hypothetical protein